MKPLVTLERNNAGRLGIGVTEFDSDTLAVRSYMISTQSEHIHDEVMRRRYADIVRLMGDNVTSRNMVPKCENCDQEVEWVEYSGPIDGTGGGGVWESTGGHARCDSQILRDKGWEQWEVEAHDGFHVAHD